MGLWAELLLIAWVRKRYLRVWLTSSLVQLTLGGALASGAGGRAARAPKKRAPVGDGARLRLVPPLERLAGHICSVSAVSV